KTFTPMGHRLVRQWVSKPLLNVVQITGRQQAVAYFVANGVTRIGFRDQLHHLGDLERLANRVAAGNAIPRDLVALRDITGKLPEIRKTLPDEEDVIAPILEKFSICAETHEILSLSIA